LDALEALGELSRVDQSPWQQEVPAKKRSPWKRDCRATKKPGAHLLKKEFFLRDLYAYQ
jgi:hypothetical protein